MSNKRIPLDLSDFTDAPKPKSKPTKEQIDEVASESGFTTRHAPRQAEQPEQKISKPAPKPPTEPVAADDSQQEPMRRGRKRTTNRNTPFAVKLKLETNNAIYRLAEELECNAIAEVIERAIAALEKEIASGRR